MRNERGYISLKVAGIACLVIILMVAYAFFCWSYFSKKAVAPDSASINNSNSNFAAVSDETFSSKALNYTIPGVPYIGVFNHQGRFSQLSTDSSAAIASVLEYWNPGKYNFVEIEHFIYDQASKNRLINGQSIQGLVDYLDANSLRVQEDTLQTADLKKYVNPKTRTPLLVLLPMDENEPAELSYHLLYVLIGVNDESKQLTFHDFWLGNNYTMTYDQLDKLWAKMRPEERNKYIIIQPRDLAGKLKEMESRSVTPYPARTALMEKTTGMFSDYALSRGADALGFDGISMNYDEKIMTNPDFEQYFPPYFKVMLYSRLSSNLLNQKQYDDALMYANKAVELNHDLDKPSGDWPGFVIWGNDADIHDKTGLPYVAQGDAYRATNNLQKAKDAYQQALAVKSSDQRAMIGLGLIK